MKLNVVDYYGCPGGGARFASELLQAMCACEKSLCVELISHGNALIRYRQLFGKAPFVSRITDIPPANILSGNIGGLRGSWRLLRLMGIAEKFYEIPQAATADCDAVWFPWAQKHRLISGDGRCAVATYHDLNIFEADRCDDRMDRAEEDETLATWFRSPAKIVTSSDTSAEKILARSGAAKDRVHVIPLTGNHAINGEWAESAPAFPWCADPFLLCPANTARHKNHEVLFQGIGAWGCKYPLVLTGSESELPWYRSRGFHLRRIAAENNLHIGRTLHPLGYVPDSVYFNLLYHVWAMVMPTLAEGGGSFPVWEALWKGVPILCSDIPIMREMLRRAGGEVLFFNPRDASDLAEKLDDLETNYTYYKNRALDQIRNLKVRSWKEIASDYLRLLVL